MKEKLLFNGKFFNNKVTKPFAIVGGSAFLVGAILANTFDELYHNSKVYVDPQSYWSYGSYENNEIYSAISIFFAVVAVLGGICLLIALIALIIYLFFNCKMVVTDKRVYAMNKLGKKVELPLDSITAIGLNILSIITVTTPSGKIKLIFMKNRNEAYDIISKLLINRQTVSTQANESTFDIQSKEKADISSQKKASSKTSPKENIVVSNSKGYSLEKIGKVHSSKNDKEDVLRCEKCNNIIEKYPCKFCHFDKLW